MKQYNLADDDGANDDRSIKLTDKARRYFQTEIDVDTTVLRNEFAQSPPLFAHLLDGGGGTVDDAVARTHLKIVLGMNEQSARTALNMYKSNLSHAISTGEAATSDGESEIDDSNAAED